MSDYETFPRRISKNGTMMFPASIPWETTDEIGVTINHHVTDKGDVYHDIFGHKKGYTMWRKTSDPEVLFMFITGNY